MAKLCLSSETYKIDIKDIAVLADSDLNIQYKNSKIPVVLLGDTDKGTTDSLLCGRNLVEQALNSQQKYIAVKIAFVTKIKPYNIITPFIKRYYTKYKFWSSNIYHMDPLEIRRLKIERSFRDKDSAYTFSNPLYRFSESERKERYENLYNSMKNGYDDNYPIDIMLLRMLGIKDTVNNGHHRMGIAVECELPQIAVQFSAAGSAPSLLRPILRIIAAISMRIKQIRK